MRTAINRLSISLPIASSCGAHLTTAASATKSDVEQLNFDDLKAVLERNVGIAPQRPYKFQKLFEKSSGMADTQAALQLLLQDRRQRDLAAIHKPYSTHLTQKFFASLQGTGAVDLLFESTARTNELGLRFSARLADTVMRQFALQGDLQSMEKFYLYSQLYLAKPSAAMVFTILKSFFEAGEFGKVLEYADDAAKAGIHLRPSAQQLVINAKTQQNSA